jgi:hypothetical protein
MFYIPVHVVYEVKAIVEIKNIHTNKDLCMGLHHNVFNRNSDTPSKNNVKKRNSMHLIFKK